MKKGVFVGLIVAAAMLGVGVVYAQQMQTAALGQGYAVQQGWNCPGHGGMQGHHGMGGGMMCPGMTGQGRMMHHGQNVCPYAAGQQLAQPVSPDQARTLLENYLQSTGNPNLKLGNITEEKEYFAAEITTKEGSLVDKLQVDKNTGMFRSVQ